jgi:hypothetical protein
MSDTPKTPPELDAIARVVLAYKPKKAKAKVAKKRKKIARLKKSSA